MHAAIGINGKGLVVWGLGETSDAAIADARTWLHADNELVCTEVSADVAARIEDGEINCDALGLDCTRLARDLELFGQLVEP